MPPQYSALTEYLCLEARGADAGAFLHAQLSQAVDSGAPGRAPLAGWHDARGRVRGLLRVLHLPERWLLVTARDGAPQLLQRLTMFILRSAVKLEVAADVEVAAVLGAEPPWLTARGLPGDATAGTRIARANLHWICVGQGYWHVLGLRAGLDSLAESLPSAPTEAAALAEIGLGLPLVTAGLADRYIAQMLNLDALGALAFDKGCYPGQEVIARVHNLGDVKRRLRRYAADAPAPPVDTAVLDDRGAAVGEVVRNATSGARAEVLAVVEHMAADRPLTSGGSPLAPLPLPFKIPRNHHE